MCMKEFFTALFHAQDKIQNGVFVHRLSILIPAFRQAGQRQHGDSAIHNLCLCQGCFRNCDQAAAGCDVISDGKQKAQICPL